jgi:hypothetical protein
MTVSFEPTQTTIDVGTVTGSALTRTPYLSIYRKTAIGQDQTLFNDSFNATAQNTGVWRSASNLATFGFSGGFVVFNSGAITTTGAAQIYQTYRTFPLFESAPLIVDTSGFGALPLANNVTVEVGLFSANLASTPYTPTDGVFYRATTTGGLIGVISYNGVETTTGVLLPAAALQVGTSGTYRIVTTLDITEFWGVDASGNATLFGTLPTPSANGQPFAASSAPLSMRVAFTGTASNAYSLKFSNVSVVMSDMNTFRPWNVSMCGMGQAYQGLNGGTMGSLALYTNSLAAGAGASLTLQNPIVVNPGEFFAICAKNLGVVTSTGVITFLVTIDHYFE